jgi:hypothetical protein
VWTNGPVRVADGRVHWSCDAAVEHRSSERWLLAFTLAGLAGGTIAAIAGSDMPAAVVWTVTAVAAIVPTAIGIVQAAMRRQPGVDVIALLALGARSSSASSRPRPSSRSWWRPAGGSKRGPEVARNAIWRRC